MIRQFILVSVLFISGLAQTYGQISGDMIQAERELAGDMVERLMAVSSAQERKVMKGVDVNIVRSFNTKLAIADRQSKRIILGTTFLAQLHMVARAMTIEMMRGSDGRQLVEPYLQYVLGVSSVEGTKTKSLDEFAKLSAGEGRKLDSNLETGIYINMLVAVLAHEYGHHVKDAFYHADTPNDQKVQVEKTADRWSYDLLRRAGISPLLGVVGLARMLSVVDDVEFWGPNGPTHPEPMERAAEGLSGSKASLRTLYQGINDVNTQLARAGVPGAQAAVMDPELLVNQHLLVRKVVRELLDEQKQKTGQWYREQVLSEKVKGHQAARYSYRAAHMFLRGYRAEHNEELARVMFMLSSAGGHPHGALWAATMFENGWGGDVNLGQADRFYKRAVQRRVKGAKQVYERFLSAH